MNPADEKTVKGNQPVSPFSTTIGKERESLSGVPSEAIQSISTEIEIPEEVERVGVTKVSDTIEIPPDIKKLGVTSTYVSSPTGSAVNSVLPKVVLPISDEEVVTGLHAQITSALRWLSVWCIKRLKKAHLVLKTVHGKIMRVIY